MAFVLGHVYKAVVDTSLANEVALELGVLDENALTDGIVALDALRGWYCLWRRDVFLNKN